MPEIPIEPNSLDNIENVIDTAAHILSYRMVPELGNEKKREQAYKSVRSHYLSQMKRDLTKIYADYNYTALKNEIETIPLLKGIPDDELNMALLHIPRPKDIFGNLNKVETRKEINTVCCIILFLLQQAEYPSEILKGISLNNAKLMLSKLSKGITHEMKKLSENVLLSDGLIHPAWSKYKTIAHLIFACTLLEQETINLIDPKRLRKCLALAHDVQQFLLGIKPKNSKNPLITKNDMWYLPEWTGHIEKYLLKIPPYLNGIEDVVRKNPNK